MCQFIETMLVNNDTIVNIDYHNERLNRTLKHLSPNHEKWDLKNFVYPIINKMKKENNALVLNNYKARFLYEMNNVIDVSISEYNIRKITSLQCVICDDINYDYKSADRYRLNELFSLRGERDDIMIIKNGLVTDTSICNVALWNGSSWLTPRKPLHKGTRRQSLIDSGVIEEMDIKASEIKFFHKLSLFNAMIGWQRIVIDIGSSNSISY